MGQKVHPYGIRVGYNKNWLSRWFSTKEYPAFVLEDSKIRKFVKKHSTADAGIARIEIERAGGKVRLIISTSRPGVVIGRKGVEIEKLRADLRKEFGREFSIEVSEIRRPEVEAQLVRPCPVPASSAARASRSPALAAWPVPKSPAANGTVTVACRCRPCVPT